MATHLANRKGDYNHSRTVSIKNCMLRIPGTLNSDLVKFDCNGNIEGVPSEAEVRPWDNVTPQVGLALLRRYYIWRQTEEIKRIERQKIMAQKTISKYGSRKWDIYTQSYDYIGMMLDKPVLLDDFRNFCIWRVTVPYLINIKGMSRLETFNRVADWLNKCNSISKLKFNPIRKIDDELNRVGTYWPIADYQLREEHPRLYERLDDEGCFNHLRNVSRATLIRPLK